MKIIDKKIYLEDNDEIVVTTNKNYEQIRIKCLKDTLFLDEERKKNDFINEYEEKKAIAAMDEYLKNEK